MTSSDKKLLPSGLSVSQAKKDAKRLARSEGMPLYQALNETARQNGANAGWHKAMAASTHSAHYPPLKFNTAGVPFEARILKPGKHVAIVGQTGRGKTVLVQNIVTQLAVAGVTVGYAVPICNVEIDLQVGKIRDFLQGMGSPRETVEAVQGAKIFVNNNDFGVGFVERVTEYCKSLGTDNVLVIEECWALKAAQIATIIEIASEMSISCILTFQGFHDMPIALAYPSDRISCLILFAANEYPEITAKWGVDAIGQKLRNEPGPGRYTIVQCQNGSPRRATEIFLNQTDKN